MNLQGWRNGFLRAAEPNENGKRTRSELLRAALLGMLAILASPWARQWLGVLIAVLGNICILGGILAAPIVSVVAWVGMILPSKDLLHQIAPTLMSAALIWLAAAIIGAHVFRLRHHAAR